jgi:hypothetical protein
MKGIIQILTDLLKSGLIIKEIIKTKKILAYKIDYSIYYSNKSLLKI